jgi:Family of unknown function (DUF6516)
MLTIYQTLAAIALREFSDVITQTRFIGGTPISPNKLRLTVTEGSFIDIWLTLDGDYAYHWERRKQTGEIYRWDNAPHHPQISTFPDHFHEGDEHMIVESTLNLKPESALREILEFIKQHL